MDGAVGLGLLCAVVGFVLPLVALSLASRAERQAAALRAEVDALRATVDALSRELRAVAYAPHAAGASAVPTGAAAEHPFRLTPVVPELESDTTSPGPADAPDAPLVQP